MSIWNSGMWICFKFCNSKIHMIIFGFGNVDNSVWSGHLDPGIGTGSLGIGDSGDWNSNGSGLVFELNCIWVMIKWKCYIRMRWKLNWVKLNSNSIEWNGFEPQTESPVIQIVYCIRRWIRDLEYILWKPESGPGLHVGFERMAIGRKPLARQFWGFGPWRLSPQYCILYTLCVFKTHTKSTFHTFVCFRQLQ